MSIRSLAVLVLTLVTGVALSVDWYLDGEREVRAETRVQHAEHLPRMLSDSAPAPRRNSRRSSPSTPSTPSTSGAGGSTVPSSRATAVWLRPVDDDNSSTALDPR
jgi:hypothetical protein